MRNHLSTRAFLPGRFIQLASFLMVLLCGPASGSMWASTYTIAIIATGPDGSNTGTARLLSTVKLEAKLKAGSHEQVGWKFKGPGTLKTNGPWATYTPPSTMPSDGKVTITTYAATYTSLSTTYTFKLLYPAPSITYNSPQQLPGGATTSITLTGKNFLPNTKLTTSAGTVKPLYKSATSMVAEVTLPGSATGTLSLRAANPTPGGGTSNAAEMAMWSIQLKAKSPDGTNTGTARLGVPVAFTPSVSAGTHNEVKWRLSGAGKLSSVDTERNAAVTYTPPRVMPSTARVTVTAYMASYPQAKAIYAFSLVNPVPSISPTSGVSPYTLLTGATQAVSITGAGFVPGTVALHNNSALATTFVDYNHVTIHVPVKDTADGNIKMQMRNPGLGGLGTSFQVLVAVNSIALTANDGGDLNTGSAEPGDKVSMTAVVTGSAKKSVTWKLSGAGSISDGTYTAPRPIPAGNAVTITAILASNPKITESYSLRLVNPNPVIAAASPGQVPAGETTDITLTGSGFMPGTVVVPSSGSAVTIYKSATTLVARIKLSDGANGELSLQAKNPAPGGGLGPYFQEAITTPVSVATAARILDQTTFGPTKTLIKHVKVEGVTGWLEEQFHMPTTRLAKIPVPRPTECSGAAFMCAESEWWQAVLTGKDQLRQRVAFALSEMYVISTNAGTGLTLPTYANMLADDAFGNWYDIMKHVTLSPGMGIYLDMLNSGAASNGEIANENFARENLQLFNVGLNLMNQDGTLKLDSDGRSQPSFTEPQVRAFARAFTGWTYANADGSAPGIFIGTPNYHHPLVAVENRHDRSSKKLLNGTTLPAGQSAERDLEDALANIFEHPNLPPFVCRQLIQHLVTGNPSPGYVERVADVFSDNGNRVRGDMKSVLIAIFTDPEARAGDSDEFAKGGHLREPILWMTAVMRALGYVNTDTRDYYYALSKYTGALRQEPFTASSVFNFFPPGYIIPGAKLNAPEFALENTASVVGRMALADNLVNNNINAFNVDLSATSLLGQIAPNASELVDELATLFLHGRISSETRNAIIHELKGLGSASQRVRVGTYLVITSADFKVMH